MGSKLVLGGVFTVIGMAVLATQTVGILTVGIGLLCTGLVVLMAT